jgi:Glycosidases
MKHWLEESIFYEIYPQSFNDSNGDGIGDIPGILEKLDYIKGLGCNAIWLNPCYLSPFGDAGYDVPGHTSTEHSWFKESCKAGPNEYWGRYIWSDNIWVDVANYEGISGSLRGLYPRNGSVAVNFFSNQPALNYGFSSSLWTFPLYRFISV